MTLKFPISNLLPAVRIRAISSDRDLKIETDLVKMVHLLRFGNFEVSLGTPAAGNLDAGSLR